MRNYSWALEAFSALQRRGKTSHRVFDYPRNLVYPTSGWAAEAASAMERRRLNGSA